MSASVGDVPARLAVLEEIAAGTKAVLEQIERRLGSMDERLRALETGIAELRGHVRQMPTVWQMITTVIGGQVALAAVVIAAVRFGLH